jgi:hypothetical protein
MEFISKSGTRISYWFTVGDVISMKSWTSRGERHHEIWIRNTDGREWVCTELPLGVNLTRGQRIAFAWCAAGDQTDGQLVAVRNCSSGRCKVLSHSIANEVGGYRYGRRAFRWLSLLTATLWGLGCLAGESSWIQRLSVTTMAAGVLGGSLLGFLLSRSLDPDPGRVVDRNVQIALAGIEQAWVTTRLDSDHRGGRTRSIA